MMPHPLSVLKKLTFFFVLYAVTLTAKAQVYNPSVSAATAGTGRAAVEESDAIFLNPGTLVHLQGDFLYTSFAEKDFAITLTDNTKENFLPASIGFVQRRFDVTQGEVIQHDVLMALAEFLTDKVAFGITGHYRQQKLNNENFIQTNADIGMIYTPKPNIGWALVAYNVFGESQSIPANFRSKVSMAGGFNYIYKGMTRFRLDANSESNYMAGIENYLNRFVVARFGYSRDTDDNRALGTAGVGFKGPRFVINYAYQGNPENSGDYRHSVDLEIPF